MKNEDFVVRECNKENKGGFYFVITLMIAFAFNYSRWCERKYYLNRRLLYHLLKTEKIKLIKKHNIEGITYGTINVYQFYYKDKSYEIWYYSDNKNENSFTLGLENTHSKQDMIGLFQGDIMEKRMCKKIVKYFK